MTVLVAARYIIHIYYTYLAYPTHINTYMYDIISNAHAHITCVKKNMCPLSKDNGTKIALLITHF